MSVFKVKLNNPQQGLLDLNPATATPYSGLDYSKLGTQMNPSIQRTIWVTGPGLKYRQLSDGDQFTDCNYWKRFAYPNVPMDQAFIEVVTDDGSVYSDDSEENTYALTFGGDTPYTVANGSAFTANVIDIAGTYGGFAKFVQVTNYGTSSPGQDVKMKINGSATAILKLAAGDTQVFNSGDLSVSKLEFQGGTSDTDLQIILSVTSVCYS
jgi:hypothetical protein